MSRVEVQGINAFTKLSNQLLLFLFFVFVFVLFVFSGKICDFVKQY